MLNEALKFIIKKAVESKLKSKKVDLQIFQCYYDIYFEIYDPDQCIDSTQEMVNGMVAGLQYFDSYGNPEKIYASMCLFFNRLLTVEEYRRYADLLVKKIVVHSELSAYVNVPVFKERIMEDFDPKLVDFPKSNLMIYKNLKSFTEYLTSTFGKQKAAVLHDKTPGTHRINKASKYHLNLSDKIYAYSFDPQLKMDRLGEDAVGVNVAEDTVTIRVEKHCSICVSNTPLDKRVK